MKKTLMILFAVCVFASVTEATEYYFRTGMAGTNMVASFTSDEPRNLNPMEGRILIAVTQAQWGTGSQADFDALDPAVITAGIDAAKTQAADFAEWDERIKAIAKLMRKEINLIRAAHGLPEYSVAEWKAKLKAEM